MILLVVPSCRSLRFSESSTSSISYQCFIRVNPWLKRSTSFYLPVFDESIWNFLQKTRRPLKDIAVAATQAHVRIGKIKLIARACDGHVEQAPFFLQRVAGIE